MNLKKLKNHQVRQLTVFVELQHLCIVCFSRNVIYSKSYFRTKKCVRFVREQSKKCYLKALLGHAAK